MDRRPKVEALLFDLGGVVIDIDFDRSFRSWAAMSSLSFEQIKAAFRFDLAYERHERGEICSEEYFESLRSTLGIQGSDEEIAGAWNAIYLGPIEEALAAVTRAREKLSCYGFTNTNPTHQSAWKAMYPAVAAAFDRVFASCELGLRKPERAAFEAVAAAIGVPAPNILFFDDTLENVEAAIESGLRAIHVTCPGDIRDALAVIGCPV